MSEHWIVYRDITDFPRKQFERIAAPKPGALVIKDQVFPGGHGFPAMYIKHHKIYVDRQAVNLITYTEAPVSIKEAAELARQALDAGENP